MSTDLWVIKDTVTGKFMPNVGKGYTFLEVEQDFLDEINHKVRFFGRKQDAKLAIKYWEKGRHEWEQNYNPLSGNFYDEGFEIAEVPKRKEHNLKPFKVFVSLW